MKRNIFLIFVTVALVGIALLSGCSCGVSEPTGRLNGYGYVDLGLPSGTLWATCNVGAASPKEYGDYFAWGETTTKKIYNWRTYKYCSGDYNTLTKYCKNADYGSDGFTDALTILETSDDAATANWGAGWRMPTKDDWEELKSKCKWTCMSNGYKVVGPNRNSIFLPTAGCRRDSTLYSAGSDGYYWSSSLDLGYQYYAWNLYFYSDDCIVDYLRSYGRSVRPVCKSTQN